jgi:hypothetical protein
MEKKEWTKPTLTSFGNVEDLTLMAETESGRAWCIPFQRVGGIPKHCGLGDAVSQGIGLPLGS